MPTGPQPLPSRDDLLEAAQALVQALGAGLDAADGHRAAASLARARDLARSLASALDIRVGDAVALAGNPVSAGGSGLARLAGHRLLVVDDNGLSLTIMERLLERAGVSVTAASGGSEALSLLREQPFDAVLIDVYMPDMDGMDTARRIRADPLLQHIPVVAMSASDDHDERARCAHAGMTGFVNKPVDPAQLASVLQSALSPSAPG